MSSSGDPKPSSNTSKSVRRQGSEGTPSTPPGPSSSSLTTATVATSTSAQPGPSTDPQWAVYINQRMSGMPPATNLPEWQLQAVLFHAKLTQYYSQMIALGGDDIDQLMQCDESEFLEIMRLLTMATKPLHVRRFQRTLAEFSKDRATFLRNAAVHIGPPPVMDLPTSSQTTALQAALQFLVPGYKSGAPASQPGPSTSSTASGIFGLLPPTSSVPAASLPDVPPILMPRLFPQPSTAFFSQPIATSTASGAPTVTANIIPYSTATDLLSLVAPTLQIPTVSPSIPPGPPSVRPSSSQADSPVAGPSGCGSNQSIASPGSELEYIQSEVFEGNVLSEADILQIVRLAKTLYVERTDLHTLRPKYVQNKKKLSKDLLGAMDIPPEDKNRLREFRKYSAIYGRFDTKRVKNKPLSYHEHLINEAAAQLCLLQPVLLTRRDNLFPLAREVVKKCSFPGLQVSSRPERPEKRRHHLSSSKSERSTSPSPRSQLSNPSESPEPSTSEKRLSSSRPDQPGPSGHGGKRPKTERP